MPELRFVFFEGISILSRLIRFWTRSSISHVAYLSQDFGLIEAWKFWDGARWGFSSFANHTPGTPYSVWSIEAPKDPEAYFLFLARTGKKWDLRGVLGFALKCSDDRERLFCAEGCCEGLKEAGLLPKEFESWRITPVLFREVLRALGGRKVDEGIVRA